MILAEISDTSIIISKCRNFYRWYHYKEQRLRDILHNSQTYSLTKRFWAGIKICFRYSLLARITGSAQKTYSILENSRIVQFLFNLYKKWKINIMQFLKASSTTYLAKDTKEQLNFSPLRIISMIVITAITTNIVLSFVLQKPIGLWGWVMRGLFFSVAVLGLFSQADWRSVKGASVFLRKMGRD